MKYGVVRDQNVGDESLAIFSHNTSKRRELGDGGKNEIGLCVAYVERTTPRFRVCNIPVFLSVHENKNVSIVGMVDEDDFH